MSKWIDLKDPSGARLKLAHINVQGTPTLHLFVTSLAYTNPKWGRVIRELGFNTPPSRKYLVRRVEAGDQLVASKFRSVFPGAQMVDMPPEAYMLATNRPANKQTQDEPAADVDMRGVVRLGRNEEGYEVFDSLSGRFLRDDKGDRVLETDVLKPHQFLRLHALDQPRPSGKDLNDALTRVALGFVRAMDMGEVQHSEDYEAFRRAVFPADPPDDVHELLSAAIDGALLRYVREKNDVAQEAFSPMSRLYDYLPPYRGKRRGEGAMPPPLNIAAQRLLGDTKDKTVLYPNAFDGAGFAFLPEGTQIRAYRGQEGVVDLSDFAASQEGVTWLGKYTAASEVGANALFFNADPLQDASGARRDYIDAMQCLRSMAPGARAILVLAADDDTATGKLSRESARFVTALGGRYSVEDLFETAPILSRKSGGSRGLRVFSLRNVAPIDRDAQIQKLEGYADNGLPVLTSWDAVKSHVDETIHRIDLKEAESQSIDLERAAANEIYQRPYLAFSKVGEARSMVPANLQASNQAYLTRLEAVYGPVDEFIQQQLGMGFETLKANFSPEQVDGMAVMISRVLVGRSSLLADDTGMGKGRQLAGLATWANKRAENIIFVTDRANLFSDLARDLKHIGEWDRFRPLVVNADGEITFEEYAGAVPTVLAKGTPGAVMADILERNLSLEDLQVNAVFLTYSQISTEESAKALWLKNQLANSLVIFDEAHIAAGSDSNIAVQVAEIASLAKHVQFASATWAKTHDNMHIYQRAFPASVSVGTLAETMRKGGDSFSEIFSTMLSAEGALIRREHDLSKLEVEMVIDEKNRARNEHVSDQVADVLGSAAFISGDMQQVFMRANAQSVARLRGARDVRSTSIKANLFSSSFGSGSVIYQVMKAVQGSLNATHVADLAIASVARGMKPVIISDATGESLVEAMLDMASRNSPDGKRPEFMKIPTLRDCLRHVLYKRLATVRVEEVTALDVALDEESQEAGEAGVAEERVEASIDSIEHQALVPAADVNAEELPAIEAAPAQQAEEGIDIEAAYSAIAAPVTVAVGGDTPLGSVVGEDGDEGEAPARGKKVRRKRVFRDVLISDMSDMPEQAKQRYAEGLQEIEDKIMAVPDLPVIGFDVIAQRLRDAGITVGEISGRKSSLVLQDGESGVWQILPRSKSKKAVKATIRSFNNGGTQCVIMNRSAAAGVSMHASPQFLDQSRRHLIEHQIPEDPVIRVQLLGRVNRYDQLSTPLMTSASTGIFGEVRYLMMQNRKLARMSANVRSSRDNAMSLKGVTDLFNIVGRQAVKSFLQDNPLIAKRLGIKDEEIEWNPDIVNKLTMHIPMLRVSQQEVVYNELYSRVDEIMLRAELEGYNPLRPNEMDIRAKTDREIVFFGDDSVPDEFTSAFDEPVIARRITWEQNRSPLSYTAVREAAKVNIERLVKAGYLLETEPDAQPKVNPELLAKVLKGYFDSTRLAHMATDAVSYEEAMIKSVPAKRSYLKYAWMKENLKHLVPGARVAKVYAETQGNDAIGSNFEETILTDVQPPENHEHLLDPGKWKLTVVTSGDERPQTYTLRSVISEMDGGVSKGEVTGDLLTSLYGPSLRTGLFTSSQSVLRNYFDMQPRGKRSYDATVLTGNMYLAAEWAAATKQGNSAIYTDDSGFRHRVIKLEKDAGAMDPQYLPVRVADTDMLVKFLLPLASPPLAEEAVEADLLPVHVLDTSFKSALAGIARTPGMTAKRDAVMAIVPGEIMAMSCSPKDVRRLRLALSSGQVGSRKALMGAQSKAADDPAHVIIRSHTSKKEIGKLPESIQRSMKLASGLAATGNIFSVGQSIDAGAAGKEAKVSVLSLQIKTPEQVARAVELIRAHSGLEVYASTPDLKTKARAAISDVLAKRRTEMRQLQDQLRQSVSESARLARGEMQPANPEIIVLSEENSSESGGESVRDDMQSVS